MRNPSKTQFTLAPARLAAALTFALLFGAIPNVVRAQQSVKKPNILVIFGDDVGYWNISAYNLGMTG
jgi:arylsulfatase